MNNHQCFESEKLYAVSAEGKAQLLARCPDCGGLTENPPTEAKTCDNASCCCCAIRCITLPDGGVWGVTLNKAQQHLAEKLRNKAQEDFERLPNVDKAKKLQRKLKDGSPFHVFAVIIVFLGVYLGGGIGVVYAIQAFYGEIKDGRIFFAICVTSMIIGGISCALVGVFLHQRLRRKIESKLKALDCYLPPSNNWEDYLDQVKIEITD